MANADSKTCSACGQVKPLTEFHKNARMAAGYRSSCKPCTLAINRASVLKHHDRRKEEKREVYRAARNTPEYKAYVRAYQAATKEQKRAYDREYRARFDPDITKQRAREWAKNNPDRRRAICSAYDGRRRAAKSGGVSGPELRAWANSQIKRCYWCGKRCAKEYHVDHYVPLARGGEHELHNLVIACPPCNYKKNAKDPLEFAREVGRLL